MAIFRLAARVYGCKSVFVSAIINGSSHVSVNLLRTSKSLPSSVTSVLYSTISSDELWGTTCDHSLNANKLSETIWRKEDTLKNTLLDDDRQIRKNIDSSEEDLPPPPKNYLGVIVGNCLFRANVSKHKDYSLEQIWRALNYFTCWKDCGHKIEEPLYGECMLYLVQNSLVDEFLTLHRLVIESNPNVSHPKLAYYEMLLWEKVNNVKKIQELCCFALDAQDDSSGEKSCAIGHLLPALANSGRKKEFLMLLNGLDITKATNFIDIFRCLGKFELDDFAETYCMKLKYSGIDAENISSFIYEFVINIPNIRVEETVQKFQELHKKLEVLTEVAQNEKLIRHCCTFDEVHVALELVDDVYQLGGSLSLDTILLLQQHIWHDKNVKSDSDSDSDNEKDIINKFTMSIFFGKNLIVLKRIKELKTDLVIFLAEHMHLSAALGIYNEIKQDLDNPKVPSILVEKLLQVGELNMLLQFLEGLCRPKLWDSAFISAITYCLQHLNLRATVVLFGELLKKDKGTGYKEMIFSEVFCKLTETMVGDVDFGLNLLQTLKEEVGFRPRRKLLDLLLSACAEAKNANAAFIIWKEYEMVGIKHTVFSRLRMYHALLASGDHISAEEILSTMASADPHIRYVIKVLKTVYLK